MEQYLIDTNVISDFLTNSLNDRGTAFISNILDTEPILSFVTQIELLSWKADEQSENIIASFVKGCEVKGVSTEIINHCVKLEELINLRLPMLLLLQPH